MLGQTCILEKIVKKIPVNDAFTHNGIIRNNLFISLQKEVSVMARGKQNELRTQIEYGNLDQRGNLTGPDDSEKGNYPRRPQHIPIQQKSPHNEE